VATEDEQTSEDNEDGRDDHLDEAHEVFAKNQADIGHPYADQ